MGSYTISFQETVDHEFQVEADSVEQVFEKFEELASAGNLDFSNGQPTNGVITAITCNNTGNTEKTAETLVDLERYKDVLISYQ